MEVGNQLPSTGFPGVAQAADQVFVFGGLESSTNELLETNYIWDGAQWTAGPNMTQKRFSPCAVAMNDNIAVILARSVEFLANPHQIVRILLLQRYPRPDASMNERIIALDMR